MIEEWKSSRSREQNVLTTNKAASERRRLREEEMDEGDAAWMTRESREECCMDEKRKERED